MAATIRPNEINMATTPTLSNKTLPAPQSQQKAEKKITAPRIDLEPLYVAVKGAISDADWATYKSTISAFLLGQLNQEELSAQLDRILTTPALEHAHNQFIISIYANALREPPEPGTASWADDKVVGKVGGAGGKGSGSQGDEAEKRLKHEVMHIARRERKRLKTLHDEGWDPFYQEMVDMADAKKIHTPDTGSVSAGGYQKTSKSRLWFDVLASPIHIYMPDSITSFQNLGALADERFH
jgi:transcriptional coactivator HFI1/ADA1